jgi:GTPase SAR1 family protein
VLLLGASGTGKTTFVNGLINYLFGVTFADDFRFSIVAAEDNEPFGKVPVSMVFNFQIRNFYQKWNIIKEVK